MSDLQSDSWTESSDLFENLAVKNFNNESTLASHYEYNSQRWRLFKGSAAPSNRLFPEYGNVSEYNHTGDVHELIPAGGETIILESTERYRYRVSYELLVSWALSINQSLNVGDHVRFGYFDGSNGWFLEHNGSHDSLEVDAVILRDGSEVYRESGDLSEPLTTFSRFALESAWYNVSRQLWTQSYGDYGQQKNEEVLVASHKDKRGSKSGNQPIRFEVKADANTTGLVLNAGSAAMLVKGNVGDISRSKSTYIKQDITTTGSWTPLAAFKEVDSKKVVNNQLRQLGVLAYGSSVDVQLLAVACSKAKVTFDGTDSWGTPNDWSENNTSLVTRSDVNEFPDSTGALVTSTTDPGGIQIGKSVLTGGNRSEKIQPNSSNAEIKSVLPNGDFLVILARTGTADTISYRTEFLMDY